MGNVQSTCRSSLVGLLGFVFAAALWPVPEAQAQSAEDTLRVAVFSKARTRGNVYDKPFTSPGSYWWEAVYDSFIRIDDKAQLLPQAAVSWQNVNPTTWHIRFRDGLTFSNGVANNSANVKALFDYFLTDEGKVGGVISTMDLASHRIVDNQTIELVTKKPDPLLMAKFGAMYLADMKAFTTMGIAAFSNNPVGSGPYKVTSWNDQEMVATSNEKSWRPGKVKNLRINEVPDVSTRVASVLSGETDIAITVNIDDIPTLRKAGHMAVVESAPLVNALAFFTEDFANKWKMGGKTPFSDRRVRQAFNYAVNKDAIVDQFLLGNTRVSAQPATPSTFGYNPDLKPYPYDLAKAKALMAEAGYPDGFPLIMETRVDNVVGGAEVMQIIAADLLKIGVALEVRAVPTPTWASLLNGKKWAGDMTQFSAFVAPPIDAATPFFYYACDYVSRFTCIESLNPLLAAQATELDRGKREAQLKELMRQSHEEAMALYLYDGIDVTGVAKRVQGFSSWHRNPHFEAISLAK